MILAIDPGIRGCGVALFNGRDLESVAYVRNAAPGDKLGAARSAAWEVKNWLGHDAAKVDVLAGEWPQVYTVSKRGKKDPNDLLALCAIHGALSAFLPWVEPVSILPREWKGQMTKEACQHRIAERLTTGESAIVENYLMGLISSLEHNVWDAVGIGLHHVGRFKPKRVFAR